MQTTVIIQRKAPTVENNLEFVKTLKQFHKGVWVVTYDPLAEGLNLRVHPKAYSAVRTRHGGLVLEDLQLRHLSLCYGESLEACHPPKPLYLTPANASTVDSSHWHITVLPHLLKD
jgi:hypothetical protein